MNNPLVICNLRVQDFDLSWTSISLLSKMFLYIKERRISNKKILAYKLFNYLRKHKKRKACNETLKND